MSAREVLPCVKIRSLRFGIRSSRLCGLPADRLSTSPRISARYILSRISRFFGVSIVVGLRAHSTTISMPCLVISGGVRWPIGVLSSSFAECRGHVGRGFDHGLADGGILHRFEERVCLVAGLMRVAQASASLCRAPVTAGPSLAARSARPAASCIRSLRSRVFVAAVWACTASDVFFADLQAFLEAAAHQAGPDHIGPHACLERFRPDALGLERLGQLVRR